MQSTALHKSQHVSTGEKHKSLLLALNAANIASIFPALVTNSQLDHHHVPSNGSRHEQ